MNNSSILMSHGCHNRYVPTESLLQGYELPRRSLAGAAAIAPTPDTEADSRRGRNGPETDSCIAIEFGANPPISIRNSALLGRERLRPLHAEKSCDFCEVPSLELCGL